MSFEKLNAPFKYEEYNVNYDGFVTVGPQSVTDRLNEVFGIFNWSHDILEYHEDLNEFTISVRGLLKVKDPDSGDWITRTQFGDKKIVAKTNERPKPQAILDAKKSAVSDSLKKCASLFGVASDVYKGRIKAITPNSDAKLYNALYRHYNLNQPFLNFDKGIVVLPEDYRNQINDQFAIFESDVLAIKQNLQGNLSGYQPTFINNQIHDDPEEPTSSGGNLRYPQTKLKKENQTNSKVEKYLYEYVDMIADQHPTTLQPYYKLIFKKQGELVEVYAIDSNVIEFLDKINPREGSKYSLKTRTNERGALILKHLSKNAS